MGYMLFTLMALGLAQVTRSIRNNPFHFSFLFLEQAFRLQLQEYSASLSENKPLEFISRGATKCLSKFLSHRLR